MMRASPNYPTPAPGTAQTQPKSGWPLPQLEGRQGRLHLSLRLPSEPRRGGGGSGWPLCCARHGERRVEPRSIDSRERERERERERDVDSLPPEAMQLVWASCNSFSELQLLFGATTPFRSYKTELQDEKFSFSIGSIDSWQRPGNSDAMTSCQYLPYGAFQLDKVRVKVGPCTGLGNRAQGFYHLL
jgi:hypothetical protein